MREYKGLKIPNRKPRDTIDIIEKQENYCNKSDCDGNCFRCLFDLSNIEEFKEWYLAKNGVNNNGIKNKK